MEDKEVELESLLDASDTKEIDNKITELKNSVNTLHAQYAEVANAIKTQSETLNSIETNLNSAHNTVVKFTQKLETPDEIAELATAVTDLRTKLNNCKQALFTRFPKAKADWPKSFPSNKNRAIKLDPFKESAQISVTRAQNLTNNLIGRGVNNYDNTNISMVRNASRIDSDVSLGLPIDLVIILTPIFLAHAIMHFSVGLWYSFYKRRDAWDAYFYKEGKELEKIQKSLETPHLLDTATLEKITSLLIAYEKDTKEFEEAIAIAVETNAIQKKKADQLHIQDNHSDEKMVLLATEDSHLNSSAKPDEPLSLSQKAKNWFASLPGSSGFSTFFAFAWNYWFVFYYSCWGILGVSVAAVSPVFALLALAAPIIYLIYKEYVAYTTWSVANETALNEEDKKRLDSVKDALLKKNELKKILREKADEATEFRYGWLLVALIAGITIITVCGFPIIPAIVTGIAVSVGIVVFCKGIVDYISHEATLRRERLLDTSNRLGTSIEEKPRNEWSKKRISQLKKVTHLAGTLSPQQVLLKEHITYVAGNIFSSWRLTKKINTDIDEETIKETIAQHLQENIKEAISTQINAYANSTKIAQQKEQAQEDQARLNESNSRLDTVRKWAGAILDFLANYMLTCLIGFAVLNWLDIAVIPIALALGGAPIVLMDALIANIIVGILGVVFASAASYATWTAEEKESAEIQKLRDDVDNKDKQEKIQYFKAQTLTLRDELQRKLATHIANLEAYAKDDLPHETESPALTHFKKLAQLIEKPVKESKPITLRWLAKRYLWGVDGSLHVASAFLIVRAVLTLGFFATTAALAGPAALVVFGSAALATNPVGITILVLAAVVLLARLVRQFYLERQKVKELKQLQRVDQRLEKNQREYENLLFVGALLENKKDLIEHPEELLQQSQAGNEDDIKIIEIETEEISSNPVFYDLPKGKSNSSSSQETPTPPSPSTPRLRKENHERQNDDPILDPFITSFV